MSFDVVSFVDGQAGLFRGALSDQAISWEKEKQFAIQAFQKNDCLAKVAMANMSSAQNAIVNVAAIGITLNPAAKLAYLVPRDGMVCLDISYMGLLHLAQVSGAIQWGQCKLVHANDTYENNVLDRPPTHRYNAFGERGDVVGGYCTVKTAQGDYLTEEMRLAEIKMVEATSKAKNGPWQKWWDEMARKTIVKRASKYWPRCERLDHAIDHLNTDGGEGLADPMEQQQEVIANPVDTIRQAIAARGQTEQQFFLWFSKARGLQVPVSSFDEMSDVDLQLAARKLEAKR
ncbi:MAG: recombinase RecT [Aeromonadaceae bacterium]